MLAVIWISLPAGSAYVYKHLAFLIKGNMVVPLYLVDIIIVDARCPRTDKNSFFLAD